MAISLPGRRARYRVALSAVQFLCVALARSAIHSLSIAHSACAHPIAQNISILSEVEFGDGPASTLPFLAAGGAAPC